MGSAASVLHGELSSYFLSSYLEGGVYAGHVYEEDYVGEFPTFRFDAPDGPVHVWQYALHLWSPETEKAKLVVLFHYTNEFCFRNIANMEQNAAQLFASLRDDRAHFGKGVYATQFEPWSWQLRGRALLNNYSRGDPRRKNISDEEARRVYQEWGDPNPEHKDELHPEHRAGFCIPMLVPESLAFNIFERMTPDMQEKRITEKDGRVRSLGFGEDHKGRSIHGNRDIWVVRFTDHEGAVQHAEASAQTLVELLQKRLAFLQSSFGNEDLKTLRCKMELGRRLHGRAAHEQAKVLYVEALDASRKKLGNEHPHTLVSISN